MPALGCFLGPSGALGGLIWAISGPIVLKLARMARNLLLSNRNHIKALFGPGSWGLLVGLVRLLKTPHKFEEWLSTQGCASVDTQVY